MSANSKNYVRKLETDNKQQADFMALAKEEMDSLKADNALLTEQINKVISENIRFESTNKKLKKSITAEKKGHAATAKIVLDVQAENKRLQKEFDYLGKVGSQQFEAQRVEIEQLQAENKRMKHCIDEIEAVSCGETQVAEDDSEGMGWIYKRIQALKGE